MDETICDISWEGPFSWDERKWKRWIKPGHVIYALYGTHHLYGQNQLLYIGQTADLKTRLAGHASWVSGEYDKVRLRVATVGVFPSVEAWWNAWDQKPARPRYKKAKPDIVKQVEALLIYAHQPAYNAAPKSELDSSRGRLRVFNTGRCGALLPEISHAYFEE